MKDKIKDWVEENRDELGIGESDFSLEEMTGGESNHVFKLVASDKMVVKASDEMIVRTSLDISEDKITHESKILDMLEEAGVEDVPRKIYYEDSDLLGQPALVETFEGDQNVNVREMNDKQLENFARKLAEIHSLKPEIYNEKFGENEPETASMKKEMEGNFEKYSKQPYEEYKRKTDSFDSRVEEFFERQKELYQEMTGSKTDLPWRLVHGDPSNNVRTSENEIYLIDWELAKPGVPRFELIYMFRHNKMEDEEREKFLENYRQHRNTWTGADKYAEKWEKFLAFNDMIWAAKRKERVKQKGDDPSKYEEMFERRLNQLEKFYRED